MLLVVTVAVDKKSPRARRYLNFLKLCDNLFACCRYIREYVWLLWLLWLLCPLVSLLSDAERTSSER